jgi:hydrogenase/urease accessory protein HupE
MKRRIFVFTSLRKLFVFFIASLFLLTTAHVSAHNLPMGGSRWCFGTNTIIGNIDLSSSLLGEIQEIKEGHFDLYSLSDEQRQHLVSDILQPYIDKKLSITVGGKKLPIKVNKIVSNGSIFTIWLSVDNISFTNPVNPVKIGYNLLFAETNNAHVNLAYGYLSDATGDALQRVFNYSQPAMQYTFDHNNSVWEVSIKSAVPLPAAGTQSKQHSVNINTDGMKVIAGHNIAADAQIKTKKVSAGAKTVNRPIAAAILIDQKIDKNPSVSSTYPAGSSSSDNSADVPVAKSQWSNIGEFMVLGIEHILTGYDHIAFLLVLIVIGLSTREVLKIITAFTVAHSITLLLAAMQIITLSSRLVELAIAFSICFVAIENLFKKKVNYRWIVTFVFGLIHGFGFASVLQELIVGKSNLIVSVVSFNAGVEIGQLMIFLVMLPILYLLKNKIEFRKLTVGVSLAVFILGFTWLIERGFNLKLLPI